MQFFSYLSCISLQVFFVFSFLHPIKGSVLGPFFFYIYTLIPVDHICSHYLKYHLYPGDSHIYTLVWTFPLNPRLILEQFIDFLHLNV